MCCIGAAFFVGCLAQRHRFNQRTDSSPTSQIMDANQLEALKNKKAGVKGDKKGMEDIMDSLYEEYVANKDLDDWENVRGPRTEEPETIQINNDNRAAKINKRTEENVEEFSVDDYAKINTADISFDLGLDEDDSDVNA